MKKVLIVCIVIAACSLKVKAQDSSSNIRCFPFGTSLYRARVSSDGSKLSLQNVYFNYKVFDLQTGKMIGFAKDKDWSNVIMPLLEPNGYNLPQPFSIRETEIREGKRQDYLFKVKDSLGNVITEVLEEDATRYSFDGKNGNLVLATGKTISLYTPGKKKKKIGKAENRGDGYPDTWSFIENAVFSPDGRYLVSKEGYVTDLKEAKTLRRVFVIDDRKSLKTAGSRPFDITFNAEGTTCTVSIHEKGLCTYELKTGALLDSVPIPNLVLYPALQDIFEILQVPNSKDYIYWLNFFNKAASGGIAYYVKDGSPLPICDPNWEKESSANFSDLISQQYERLLKENAAAEKLRKEQEAYRLAHPNEKPSVTYAKPEMRLVKQVCNYCNGTGSISFEKFIIGGKSVTTVTTDQYGNKTYKTTGGTGTATCSGCRGKKYIEVYQ
jgi:hypothetical protein